MATANPESRNSPRENAIILQAELSPGAPGLCHSFCLQQSIPEADTPHTAPERELADRQLAQTHTYIPTSRDMLNIVLGTTLGLNMAVVRFFGDYLDLERYRMENNTREEDWLELASS